MPCIVTTFFSSSQIKKEGNNIFVDTKVLSPPYEGGQGDVP